MKRLNLVSIVVIALVVLGACHTSQSAKRSISLEGEWSVIEVVGAQVELAEEPPYIGLDLSKKRIFGSTGCNSIMGELSVNAKTRKVSIQNAGSTRRFCAQMDVERAILAVLGNVNQYESISETEIKLTDAAGKQLMILKRK